MKRIAPTILSAWLLASALMPATVAHAQDGAADEARYRIELLVFRHRDQARTTREIARPADAGIDDVLDDRLARLGADPASREARPVLAGIRRVGAGEKRLLDAEAATLRRLDAYDVLGHAAWEQTAQDIATAGALPLRQLGIDSVRGTVTFFQKRYLHLAVDLSLPPADGSAAGSLLASFGATNESPTASINESRRVRPGRLVYFDQPEFGVLAMVSGLD